MPLLILTTSAGDITIDAQGDDTDIIFKGTDGGADTTFLIIDGTVQLVQQHLLDGTISATELAISWLLVHTSITSTNLDAVGIDGASSYLLLH